jgi:ABC-2 type transport system permease protein
MTDTAVRTAPTRARTSTLTGTWILLRLGLRRDRVRMTAWLLTFAFLTVGVAASWDRLYPTPESRLALQSTLKLDPSLSAILGPLFDPLSTGGLTAWRTMAGALVVLSLVVAFVVVRHTRAEEAEGRAELVRAGVVGRAAPLAAALGTAAAYCIGVLVLCTLALAGRGLPIVGSLAYGSALGLNAFVFAALAAVTAQAARTSRAANGLAGLVVGLGFVLTAYGNSQGGGALVWASPFGWAQQLRAFADERWALLLLPLATSAVLCSLALALAVRRDLGASLLPSRRGRTTAASWVRGPVGLAWRLDRGWLVAWLVATAAMGGFVGPLLSGSLDVVSSNPSLAQAITALGGTGSLTDAFIVVMVGLFALTAAGYGVATVLRLRSEETSSRAEHVWTSSVTRTAWLSGHTSTALVGATLQLALGGLLLGATYGAASGGSAGELGWRSMLAALVTAPAVWLVVALPVALVGVAPRWAAVLGWTLLGWCVLVGWFGVILGLPDWLSRTAPTGQVPLWPSEPMRWLPEIVLTAVAVGLLVAGAIGLRRRDLTR